MRYFILSALGFLLFVLGYRAHDCAHVQEHAASTPSELSGEARAPATSGSGTPVASKLEFQGKLVGQLGSQIDQLEQSQASESKAEDLRRDLRAVQNELQALQDQRRIQAQQTFQSRAALDVQEEEQSIDREVALAQLQEQVQEQRALTSQLAQKVREMEQSGISYAEHDATVARLGQERGRLAQLAAAHYALRVQSGLASRQNRNQREEVSAGGMAVEREIQAQLDQAAARAVALTKQYEEARAQAEQRDAELLNLRSRYLAEKQKYDELQSGRSPSAR